MKHLTTILILSCMIVTAHAQTLEDYLNEAAQNNPSLKVSYSSFEASLKRVSQVNALPDPQLSFGYFVSPIETRVGAQRAKISLSQMFPWFGTLKAKEQTATFRAEAKYQEFVDRRNQLFYEVKQAYYPLFEVKQHLRLQQENLQILETYKQLATTNYANSKGLMTDVLRVDIMMEDVKTDIQILEDQVRPLEVRFNRLLNRADSMKIVIPDSLVLENRIQGLDRDSIGSSNPKILALEKKLSSLQAQETAERKNGLPKIGVGLDYAFISERTDANVPDNGQDAFMPMVTMSIPIFRKKYKSAVEESQLMQQSISYQIKATENSLVTDYESSQYELEKAIQLDSLYQGQLQKTEVVLSLLYTSYGNSGKDFEEVLRMQQQLLKYEMAQASTRTKYHMALARLTYITAKSE